MMLVRLQGSFCFGTCLVTDQVLVVQLPAEAEVVSTHLELNSDALRNITDPVHVVWLGARDLSHRGWPVQ